ncbi:MAG: hypothetical protein L0Y56_12580, partial [Nitrospira sp.]|nr:hypothetical protein [Nitrospira sp.]
MSLAKVPSVCARAQPNPAHYVVAQMESFHTEVPLREIPVRCTNCQNLARPHMVATPVYLALHGLQQGTYVIEINPQESEITPYAHVSIRKKA